MKTWNEYKEYVKKIDSNNDIEEVEQMACIISSTMTNRRKELGLSQRDLASKCGVPQSSIARIESYKTIPNLSTLLNIYNHLGLSLTITTRE